MKDVPSNFSNLKSKVDKWDAAKLAPALIDLSKLIEVKNRVVKKDVCNAKIKDIGDKIPEITNLATNTTASVKIYEVKNKIPSLTATITALT